MNVLVFGANGKTGGAVVTAALAKGHAVTVLVRDRTRFKIAGVTVVEGDATRAEDVARAMQGQEAVIDSIGGTTPYKDTVLERTAAKNIVDAMKGAGARRLIVVSMMGIGESAGQAPFWYRYLLMPTFLRGSTKDKTAMEAVVAGSGLEWVIARPPILKDDAATGSWKVIELATTGHAITRGDLADFLVGQLEDGRYVGKKPVVVNR